ncbi:transposase family protein [Actinomadura algeriensis]|uniref:DDE Tnp4 domain-containing protein n=1 Tax=Actinomadura algeriensis TaxID=1679523 RepID=A0ABR9JKS7_9ACTN|nr:hypothetical protein [Actinomadura algeriensis]
MKDDRPFYSGKLDMNPQVIASPDGTVVWVSGPLPGTGPDLAAARIWAWSVTWPPAGSWYWPTRGYIGAAPHIDTPYRGQGKPEPLKDANRSHARLRGPGERAKAQLKNWKILPQLRRCPHRAGHLAKAIHVLQNRKLNARCK